MAPGEWILCTGGVGVDTRIAIKRNAACRQQIDRFYPYSARIPFAMQMNNFWPSIFVGPPVWCSHFCVRLFQFLIICFIHSKLIFIVSVRTIRCTKYEIPIIITSIFSGTKYTNDEKCGSTFSGQHSIQPSIIVGSDSKMENKILSPSISMFDAPRQ